MKTRTWVLISAFGALLALRLTGIGYGLPAIYNSDEPHIVGLAVSFGGGSLRPTFFKYPTLWPYLLFFFYGLYFLVWSGFGILRHAADFAGLFAWNPTGFLLIGRVLSALIGLAAVWALAKAEARRRPGGWPWAAALLACAPLMNEVSHAVRPDSLMLFFVSLTWFFSLKLYQEADRASHWAAGLCAGLAMSSQYTSLFICLAPATAHLLSPGRPRRRCLAETVLAAVIGFLGASPFVALDFPNFWASMRDLSDLVALDVWTLVGNSAQVLRNAWEFAGNWSLAGVAVVLGVIRLCKAELRFAAVLLVPTGVCILALCGNPEGSISRYTMSAFPGLALIAAEGLDWLWGLWPGRWPRAALAAAAILPGLLLSAQFDRELLLPDTRRLATEWVTKNVPQGSVVLLDMPHAGPNLAMTKPEVLALLDRTRAAGSVRSRFYEAMAEHHPGGGWYIYRIGRSARDIHSSPRHMLLSQADTQTLDISSGLDAALAAKVEYAVLSGYGATPERSPELHKFFSELDLWGEILACFKPEAGLSTGPELKVYRLPKK
jgi:hypothetical protein